MKEEVEKAVNTIKEGGVILYPTDTVWGLGCDPTNDTAIEKIMAIKNRPEGKSLIVLVPSEAILQRYVRVIPEVCFDLIDLASKPLTIVYPDAQYLSKQVCAEDDSVAIRLTKHNFCVRVMQKLKSGIVSTSANLSGENAPISLDQVNESIREQVDYVVNLPYERGTEIPSQIIKIKANSEVEIIRK